MCVLRFLTCASKGHNMPLEDTNVLPMLYLLDLPLYPMSTVKLVLMKHKAKHKCFTPIYARITRNRKSSYIALGIKVDQDHWDEDTQRVNMLHPQRIRMNATLGKKTTDIERAILQDIDNNKQSSSKKLKDSILGTANCTFIEYFKQSIDQNKADGNYSGYKKNKAIYSKLIEYTRGDNLRFLDIDHSFLGKYEKWLKSVRKNKTNTIHTNLKYFRKLFNDAAREGLVSGDKNPFKTFRLKTEKTSREFLTEVEIELLDNLELDPNSLECHTRDMFVFACYTGIRISDLLTLKRKSYDGEHITIQMRKTKDTLSIQLPTRAKEIFSIYTGGLKDNDYIFPFLDSNLNYLPIAVQKKLMSCSATCNAMLKKLATKAGIHKNLTFHMSRHTFATRALRKGIRIEHVSKLLGHSDLKTTQIYTKIVNKDLDDSMAVFG